jgi:glycosyltransferase involved in cell wall biosynthesis
MIPKISVIIPVYNCAQWITRSIRSILDQTVSVVDYEVIVVNDGSTDDLVQVIAPYLNRIKFINRNENKGLPYSLNEGIAHSQGRFIIRLDSDDYVHADYLKIPYMFLSMNPDLDAVALDYLSVDEKERIISRHNCETEPIGCGIMFRHEHLIKLGLYKVEQKLHEEKELMKRFQKKYSLTRIQLPLYRYRDRRGSISKDEMLIKKYGNDYKK